METKDLRRYRIIDPVTLSEILIEAERGSRLRNIFLAIVRARVKDMNIGSGFDQFFPSVEEIPRILIEAERGWRLRNIF